MISDIMDATFVKPENNVWPNGGCIHMISREAEVQREKDAIKNDPRLIEMVGNLYIDDRDIVELEWVDQHTRYVINTDRGSILVDVNYLPKEPGDMMGRPVRFELEFHPIQPNQ